MLGFGPMGACRLEAHDMLGLIGPTGLTEPDSTPEIRDFEISDKRSQPTPIN